jgi:hypothetical protein
VLSLPYNLPSTTDHLDANSSQKHTDLPGRLHQAIAYSAESGRGIWARNLSAEPVNGNCPRNVSLVYPLPAPLLLESNTHAVKHIREPLVRVRRGRYP